MHGKVNKVIFSLRRRLKKKSSADFGEGSHHWRYRLRRVGRRSNSQRKHLRIGAWMPQLIFAINWLLMRKIGNFLPFPPQKNVSETQKYLKRIFAIKPLRSFLTFMPRMLLKSCEITVRDEIKMSFIALFLAFRDFRFADLLFDLDLRSDRVREMTGNFIVYMVSANWVRILQILVARRFFFLLQSIKKRHSPCFASVHSRPLNPDAHKKSHMQISTTTAHSILWRSFHRNIGSIYHETWLLFKILIGRKMCLFGLWKKRQWHSFTPWCECFSATIAENRHRGEFPWQWGGRKIFRSTRFFPKYFRVRLTEVAQFFERVAKQPPSMSDSLLLIWDEEFSSVTWWCLLFTRFDLW